jgi:hypothetical protein
MAHTVESLSHKYVPCPELKLQNHQKKVMFYTLGV